MNINTLKDYIEQFNFEIIDSGFKRDLQDYVNSLPNNQNNIVVLREVATNILEKLNEIFNSDLPENLGMLLVEKVNPFTVSSYNAKFEELIQDNEIEQLNFYEKLNQLLAQLNNEIQENISEIDKIQKFIDPYLDMQDELLTPDQKAIISIIFKNKKTITDLKEFTNNLQNWHKTLPIYHQILSSSSPVDIEIVNVQNGSIDLLVNLNIDLAIKLVDIFEIGFKTFLTYLTYKKMLKPIVEGYMGNKKLIKGEKARENELINNIGGAIRHKIFAQHKEALKRDKKILKNSNKMIDEVVKLVTSHILKGNDFKLLALPINGESEGVENENNQSQELRMISTQVKQAVKSLPQADMKQLLVKYKEPDKIDDSK